MLLRIEGDVSALAAGRLQGRLELHTTADADHVTIGGANVPLEIDPTAAFAQMLGESPIVAREKASFLAGDVLPWDSASQLGALEPYRPERIPVVLIHGTVSSAARWAQMVNDLGNEPEIRRLQLWAVTYSTSSPILSALHPARPRATVDALDPDGTNACLRQMVVIGHSQGGLLARLVVAGAGIASGGILPDRSKRSRSRGIARSAAPRLLLFTRAVVRRVVFIATPHRGSTWRAARSVGSSAGCISRAHRQRRRAGRRAERTGRSPAICARCRQRGQWRQAVLHGRAGGVPTRPGVAHSIAR